MIGPQEKRCSNCFKVKQLSEFYRKLNWYQSRCKACNSEVVYAYKNRNRPWIVDRYMEKREQRR